MSRADRDTFGPGEGTSRWDERIARARELAAEYSSAAEILTFYAGLAEYQRSLILFHQDVAQVFRPARLPGRRSD